MSKGGGIEHIQLNTRDPWTEVDGERASLKTKHPLFQDLQVRQAIALAKKSEYSSALSYKALIHQYERQGKATEALAVRNELGGPQSWALGAFADLESLPVGKPCGTPP